MNGIALTAIVDMNSVADGLTPAESRALHRRIRDFVPDILKPSGYRGDGERAAAVFGRHEAAKARIVVKLLTLGMGSKSFKEIFAAPDVRSVPGELRFASGLDNAIDAALKGSKCEARFELLNGSGRVRANFIYEDEAPKSEEAARIIGDSDAVMGVEIVGHLSLYIHDLIAPILRHLPAPHEPDEPDTSSSEPISRADVPHDAPRPPKMPSE